MGEPGKNLQTQVCVGTKWTIGLGPGINTRLDGTPQHRRSAATLPASLNLISAKKLICSFCLIFTFQMC